MRSWQAHKGRVANVAFSPCGQFLASCGSEDPAARVWNLATGKQQHAFESPLRTPTYLPPRAPVTRHTSGAAFSRCGRWLAVTHHQLGVIGMEVRVWGLATGTATAVHTLDSYGNAFTTTDPPGLLVAEYPRLVWIRSALDPESQEAARNRDSLRASPKAAWVTLSPDGSRVATNGRYRAVVWDATTLTPLFTRPHPRGPHNGPIAFRPDGEVVAVAHGTKVDLWRPDAPKGTAATELAGHKRPVWAVEYTPDGRAVQTVSSDETVRLWDAETGAETRRLDFRVGKLYSAAFAPDGLTCAAGTEGGAVVLWDVDL